MLIKPGVVIDGQTVHPPGWMYLLAFAIRGFAWAVAEVEKPEFDRVVKSWLAEQKRAGLEQEVAEHEQEIKRLRGQIAALDGKYPRTDTTEQVCQRESTHIS